MTFFRKAIALLPVFIEENDEDRFDCVEVD